MICRNSIFPQFVSFLIKEMQSINYYHFAFFQGQEAFPIIAIKPMLNFAGKKPVIFSLLTI